LLLSLFLLSRNGFSASSPRSVSSSGNTSVWVVPVLQDGTHSPEPLSLRFKTKLRDNRRLIAACLAFPLPLGFLGAHRVFLGTKPYIPVAYTGTLGGCLGIIPFVDFWVILFSKNFEQYMNNPKFFMWVK
jgi:TM2 domain-containing membrane protein YozV